MNNQHPIIIYLVIFIVISFLLKIFGIIEFSSLEIMGYAFIFYGISRVYLSFGMERRSALFVGTIIFLTGIIFFLGSKFDFPNPSRIIPPSFMFITGAAFLMLFIDDYYSIMLLVIAAIFIGFGIVSIFLLGTTDFSSFLFTVWDIAKKYWAVVVIMLGLILLLSRNEKTINKTDN